MKVEGKDNRSGQRGIRKVSVSAALTVSSLLVAAIVVSACGGGPFQPPATAIPTTVPKPVVVVPISTPVGGLSSDDSFQSTARVVGNFISPQQSSLAFQSGGRLTSYAVKEGDKVNKGDLIAELDKTSLQLGVDQAQAALDLAQVRLNQTKEGGTAEQIAAAKAGLASAQAAYAKVSKGPSPDDIAPAKSALDQAKAALDQAQAAYDRAGGATNPFSALLPTTVALQSATAGYQAALAQYNNAINHPTASELSAAAAAVKQAQAGVAALTPTQENIDIAQAQVKQAQVALDLANQGLENAKIIAPFGGTVLSLIPKVGETVSPGVPVVILANLDKMQIQANVDETALAGITVGQPAEITVDALGGKVLKAHVSKIGQLASSNGGLVTVPVTLDVDSTDAQVFPGLSGTVQFQAGP